MIENERLKKRLYHERSWCQKGVRFYKQQEFQIVERLSKKHPITLLCRIMNVNRSGYYKWLDKKDNPSEENFKEQKISLLSKRFIRNILHMVIDG